MSMNMKDTASAKRRMLNIAIAEAIAEGYRYVMQRESRVFPIDPRPACQPIAALTSVRVTRLVPGQHLTATAVLTKRDSFIPAALALRNAIARGGSHPSGMFVNAGAWIRPDMTVNHQASYGTQWGGRN